MTAFIGNRGWSFVAGHSSATVADFHGVPCARTTETTIASKNMGEIYHYGQTVIKK